MSVVRHTTYNLLGSLAPLVVTLVTVPLYVQAIGLDRYGLLSLCWLLAGYFTFLDFGIGRATAQRMARLSKAATHERNQLFWTSAAMSLALALVGFLLAWIAGKLFLLGIAPSATLYDELRGSILILALAVPLGIAQSLLAGTLEGRRAFGPLNIVTTAGTVLTATVPLAIALTLGPQLDKLIIATLATRIAVVITLILVCRVIVPLGRPSFSAKVETRALLGFGGWATITSIASPILVQFDRFAIGALLGATAVAYYVIGYNIVVQMLLVPSALSRALFPRFAELPIADSKRQSLQALRVLLVIAMLIAIAAMTLIYPFLSVWLGSDIAPHSAPITVILLVGFWANSAAQSAFAHLQAKARPDLTAKAHLAELIPYLAVFWFATIQFGLMGAAAAWTFRTMADFTILQKLDGIDRNTTRLVAGTFVFVMACAISQLTLSDPTLRLVVGVTIGLGATLYGYRALPEPVTSRIAALVGRLFALLTPSRLTARK